MKYSSKLHSVSPLLVVTLLLFIIITLCSHIETRTIKTKKTTQSPATDQNDDKSHQDTVKDHDDDKLDRYVQ